jgi:preprotein translocase subunit YajC
MDPMLLILLAVFAVLIFVTFRNNKKRQQQQQETQSRAVPGAEVMTSFGLFGTIRDIDEANNIVTIESTPGTLVRVHRQTIAKIEKSPVDDAAPVKDATPAAPLEDEHGEPQYGVRAEAAADGAKADAVKTGVDVTETKAAGEADATKAAADAAPAKGEAASGDADATKRD